MKGVGRLAMRVEGQFWAAYYAMPDTMKDAIPLGTIHMRFVQNEKRREMFMWLMQEAVSDIIEEVSGSRPVWPDDPIPAPEHERSRE